LIALGLDGCRGGWVVVALDAEASPSITAIPSIDALVSINFNCAAIDIPIGLPASGSRDCDKLARKLLAEHSSRVFTGVRRDLVGFSQFSRREFDAANRRLKASGHSGISIQLWNILPKVKEVDLAIRSNESLSERMREVHPELVFRRLNGDRPVSKKKDPVGLRERLDLLRDAGLAHAQEWISRQERRRLTDLLQHSRMSVQPDDVLDACAAALAANMPAGCIPDGDAPRDDCDLPMQIWF
jgi:predicted RNase H-like nuclease